MFPAYIQQVVDGLSNRLQSPILTNYRGHSHSQENPDFEVYMHASLTPNAPERLSTIYSCSLSNRCYKALPNVKNSSGFLLGAKDLRINNVPRIQSGAITHDPIGQRQVTRTAARGMDHHSQPLHHAMLPLICMKRPLASRWRPWHPLTCGSHSCCLNRGTQLDREKLQEQLPGTAASFLPLHHAVLPLNHMKRPLASRGRT